MDVAGVAVEAAVTDIRRTAVYALELVPALAVDSTHQLLEAYVDWHCSHNHCRSWRAVSRTIQEAVVVDAAPGADMER